MKRRELRKKLVDAIYEVDLEKVKEVAALDSTIVNANNSHGNGPLQYAINTGSLELVKLMIDLGADIHHRNHGGRSMLEGAAFGNNREIARHLISFGLEPTVHHVAAMGDIPCLKKMLDDDPSLICPTKAGGRWKMTPLHAAAVSRNIESVRFLLTTDVEVDGENHNGHTALALIAEREIDEVGIAIGELLLAHGANPNPPGGHHGGVLLHRAVMNGEYELAKLLLESEADPNRQDWSGKTPLHYAIARNRKLVDLLLQHSPDLTIESKQGETPLAYAKRLRRKSVAGMLQECAAGL